MVLNSQFSKTNLAHSSATVRIIGIDPGFDRMGWAVAECTTGTEPKILDYGYVMNDRTETVFQRYNALRIGLEKIIADFQPQEAAIESLFFANNQKTVMKVSEARGIIISTLLRFECNIFEYTPLQVKQAVTGFGRADKASVDKMVRLQLKMGTEKILDDTMDALAILLTHSTQRVVQLHLK